MEARRKLIYFSGLCTNNNNKMPVPVKSFLSLFQILFFKVGISFFSNIVSESTKTVSYYL